MVRTLFKSASENWRWLSALFTLVTHNPGIQEYLFVSRFVLVILALVVGQASAADPLFQSENIFSPGDKHAHSSSVVECPDGSLLACWFYGSGERTAADVVVQGARLKKGATAWSAVFLMADTPEFPDCNPVLFIDSEDRLWMYWVCVLAERWECSQLKYRRADSANGSGAPKWNWQDVIQLKPGPTFAETMKERFKELGVTNGMWAEYAKPYSRMLVESANDPFKRQTGWMTRTHPLVLPSGRILLPLYSDGFNTSLMGISDDQGETWRASSPIVGLAPIQPTVSRRRDGTLVAFCRDSGGPPARALVSESKDDGETWTPAVDCNIVNPGSSLEVIGLADGRWLLISNDTERGRNRLTVKLSNDEGITWTTKRQVEPSEEPGQFDYPSVIQSRDGLIHLTYSYTVKSGRCIRHCVLNTEWIEAGK
jgi:predicted neuraminidase